MILTEKDIRRFWLKVNKHSKNECWNWNAYLDRDGYGQFRYRLSYHRAHRISWIIRYQKPIPTGLCVLHKCDNPSCINPQHLFLGTNIDNIRDKVNKNRHRYPVGTKCHTAKLDENKVRLIRKLHKLGFASETRLAEKYNVSISVISVVVHRKTWKHVK